MIDRRDAPEAPLPPFTVGDLPRKRDFGVETRPLLDCVRALTLRGAAMDRAGRGVAALRAWVERRQALTGRMRQLRRGLRRIGGSRRGDRP